MNDFLIPGDQVIVYGNTERLFPIKEIQNGQLIFSFGNCLCTDVRLYKLMPWHIAWYLRQQYGRRALFRLLELNLLNPDKQVIRIREQYLLSGDFIGAVMQATSALEPPDFNNPDECSKAIIKHVGEGITSECVVA